MAGPIRLNPTESDQIKPFSGRLMAWMAGWTGDAGGRGAALTAFRYAGLGGANPTKSNQIKVNRIDSGGICSRKECRRGGQARLEGFGGSRLKVVQSVGVNPGKSDQIQPDYPKMGCPGFKRGRAFSRKRAQPRRTSDAVRSVVLLRSFAAVSYYHFGLD